MAGNFYGHNLRKGRISLRGHIYLVTAVTHQRRPLFADLSAGRIVVHEMIRSGIFRDTDTLAFVVMPDHFHWLLSLTGERTLSSVVGAVKRHSARKVNEKFSETSRPVWQRGFHDHALRRDKDVVNAARYIVANPLRAGLVSKIGDYPLWDAVWL
jgi:REP element-mobilizing transposase RayT